MDCGHKHSRDRREFLKWLALVSPVVLSGCSLLRIPKHFDDPLTAAPAATPVVPEDLEDLASQTAKPGVLAPDAHFGDAHTKVVNFDLDFPDDVRATPEELAHIRRILTKFRAVQRLVGAGHFNLLGMDEFFRITHRSPQVGGVTPQEIQFLESVFFRDARLLGFQGDRVFKELSDNVNHRETVKVAGTGHYLRKGPALDMYNRIQRDVGRTLILTSGVRALAKQFHLFLEKTVASDGNYSRASRSIAPPGYSFHGLYDFDVGKVGLGMNNFTDDFATTPEFKELSRLGYVDIRYKERNDLGVRFEPWHIKI